MRIRGDDSGRVLSCGAHPDIRTEHSDTEAMGQQPDVVDPLTTALNHVTTLYQAFIGQRQNLANYYMVANAFLAAAYVGAYGTKHAALTGGVALAGLAAAVGAIALDRRCNFLIRVTEKPMKELQGRLAEDLRVSTLRIQETIDTRLASRGRTVMAMYGTAGAAFLAAGIYAIVTLHKA